MAHNLIKASTIDMAEQQKNWGVTLENSALAFSTPGVTPGKWIQDTAGQIWQGIKNGVKPVLDLGRRMLEGGKELLAAISRGDIGIFFDWFKNDPIGFLAGGAAVAVGGWFLGSALGLGGVASSAISSITALASSGISSLWATATSIKIGGLTLGMMVPTLTSAICTGGSMLINLDWKESDKSILASLESAYNGFLETVGESAGRMLAGLVLGGGRNNPKLKINVSAAVALSIQAEMEGSEIEQELIEELSNLCNTFIRYAKNLAGKLGYMQFRKWARANVRTGIKSIDAKIANWGLIEGESYVINTVIDEKLEKVTEDNPALGSLLTGVKEGLFEGLGDFVQMV
ncbi:hypothetical protein QUB05_21040 [Microcoleus sp. F10-C6]|uniref:hypothetical protein n=1 Tax=unclassified Microcoleus TaxID=2642155 RepID=UPI002FD61D32